MITLERLKEVLSYNPCSGEFTWKDIAPSLQEHEAARLRPIWRERRRCTSQTGGFTFFLRRSIKESIPAA
jgi:hypothetical protein